MIIIKYLCILSIKYLRDQNQRKYSTQNYLFQQKNTHHPYRIYSRNCRNSLRDHSKLRPDNNGLFYTRSVCSPKNAIEHSRLLEISDLFK